MGGDGTKSANVVSKREGVPVPMINVPKKEEDEDEDEDEGMNALLPHNSTQMRPCGDVFGEQCGLLSFICIKNGSICKFRL